MIERKIAWWPAQAETKRWTRPVVVRMFTKMSLLPLATAKSRSWWTFVKSRVASAEPTTNVVLTSIVSPGSSTGRVPAGVAGRQAGNTSSSSTLR